MRGTLVLSVFSALQTVCVYGVFCLLAIKKINSTCVLFVEVIVLLEYFKSFKLHLKLTLLLKCYSVLDLYLHFSCISMKICFFFFLNTD